MRERQIEQCFVKACKERGFLAIKLNSSSMIGLPDRLVLAPGGNIFFAELKAPGRKARPSQKVVHKLLQSFGFKVFVIDSIEQINEALI